MIPTSRQLNLLKRKCNAFLSTEDDQKSALFLAERLYACDPCPENANIYSRAYIAANKPNAAISVLQMSLKNQDSDSLKQNLKWNRANRYLLAKCFYRQGKWQESEDSMRCIELRLHGSVKFGENLLKNPSKLDTIPNKVSGLLLLGKIYAKLHRRTEAIDLLFLCLKFDPYRWDAYEMLCSFGAAIPPKCVFQLLHTNDDLQESSDGITFYPNEFIISHPGWDLNFKMSTESKDEISLLEYFRSIARGVYFLSKYECYKSLHAFNELSIRDIRSRYVLAKVGRAYFEMAQYEKSLKYFETMAKLQPFDTDAMDYYSTSLWHLKQGTKLSALADRCVEANKLSPVTWVVIGNLFALNKEHDLALKFFKRSIQLNEYYCYAYTLCGYEVLCNEDFEKSLEYFKQAIKINSRFYNAYYGIGTVKLRQQKYESALKYFNKALEITPQHSVLYNYKGLVFEALGQFPEALTCFEKAVAISRGTNTAAKFCRAKALLHLGEFPESLREVKDVSTSINEPEVYVTMAQAYKNLEDPKKALKCLSIAKKYATSEMEQIPRMIEEMANELLGHSSKFV